MKARRARRVPIVATATILFLIVSFQSTPSQTSVPAEVPPPDPEQIAIMSELVEWLTGRPAGSEFHLVDTQEDLLDVIRERPQSFELFRDYNPTEDRRELLREVPYGDAIYRAARRYEIDSLLLAAIVEAESSFNPRVISPKGAVGLAQVVPASHGVSVEELQNPEVNLDRGARYVRWLMDQYAGDLELTLAAYNAGPGNVARYSGIPPFRETQRYVRKVLGRYIDHHQNVWERSGASSSLMR